MRTEALKLRIQGAKITQAELHHAGSITIDEGLLHWIFMNRRNISPESFFETRIIS